MHIIIVGNVLSNRFSIISDLKQVHIGNCKIFTLKIRVSVELNLENNVVCNIQNKLYLPKMVK